MKITQSHMPQCRGPPPLGFWILKISEERSVCVMAEGKEYFIRVQGTLISVTHEVYQTCHQMKRHEKTLYEKDQRNGLVSYNALDSDDMAGEESIPDRVSPGVEDAVAENILTEQLHQCIAQLSETEQRLIQALFFEERTEREYAKALGISQKAVNKRKKQVIEKLRNLMKI